MAGLNKIAPIKGTETSTISDQAGQPLYASIKSPRLRGLKLN